MPKHPIVTPEMAPLRVWLFALVILALLAALGAILVVMLADSFIFLAKHSGVGTVCCAVITGSVLRLLWA